MKEIQFVIPETFNNVLDRLIEFEVKEIELCTTPEWTVWYPPVQDSCPGSLHKQIQNLCQELIKLAQVPEYTVRYLYIQTERKRATVCCAAS